MFINADCGKCKLFDRTTRKQCIYLKDKPIIFSISIEVSEDYNGEEDFPEKTEDSFDDEGKVSFMTPFNGCLSIERCDHFNKYIFLHWHLAGKGNIYANKKAKTWN